MVMEINRKRRALGKGLEALIPDIREENRIGIDEIRANRFQPRRDIREEGIKELAESIKEKGILQPIIVRRVDEGYEIVAGERRWRAAKLAGMKEIPVIIKDLSDEEALELSLIENIQREDLNPLDLAHAYKRLIEEFGFTQEELARRLGKERSTITNYLRLLKLPEDVKERIRDGSISQSHARTLLSLKTEREFEIAIKEVAEKRLSVRDTERLVRRIKKRGIKEGKELEYVREELEGLLRTRIKIERKRSYGMVGIYFFSPEELDRIIEIIRRGVKC